MMTTEQIRLARKFITEAVHKNMTLATADIRAYKSVEQMSKNVLFEHTQRNAETQALVELLNSPALIPTTN